MDHADFIENGVEDIAASMNLGKEPENLEIVDDPDLPVSDPVAAPEVPDAGMTEPVVEDIPAPQAWAKDTHEIWKTLTPEARAQINKREQQMLEGLGQYKEYHAIGKGIKEAITPYMPMLNAAGADPIKAVSVLLNANYRLTQGPIESRKAAFVELGQSLGLINAQQMQSNEPPEVRQMRERLERLEGSLTQRQQEQLNERRTQVTNEVESFAKEAPYFDEVADDMIAFINAGVPMKQAYEKAVYANPVTRQKEIARLNKEAQDALKAKSGKAVAEAKRSTAANVRSRDTVRSPTEKAGKMEDTLTETLRDIKARAH